MCTPKRVVLTIMACGCADGSRGSLEAALASHDGHQHGEPGQQELRWSGSSGSASTTGSSDWSEGWGTGGELVSLSDLQFSRIIGEVRPPPSAPLRRQAAALAAKRSCLARALYVSSLSALTEERRHVGC